MRLSLACVNFFKAASKSNSFRMGLCMIIMIDIIFFLDSHWMTEESLSSYGVFSSNGTYYIFVAMETGMTATG